MKKLKLNKIKEYEYSLESKYEIYLKEIILLEKEGRLNEIHRDLLFEMGSIKRKNAKLGDLSNKEIFNFHFEEENEIEIENE